MTDHDFGDDQDPLLVRPFVLDGSEAPEADPSTQTWPSATTRETRSPHASPDEPPTQVIPRPAPPHRYRRRLLVIGGVGAAVVLAAAAAAFAALRPEMSPSVASGANASLPVVTGPVPSPSAPVAPLPGSPSAAVHSTHHSSPASAKASASLALSSGTPSPSEPSRTSPSAVTPVTTGAGFGPHNAAPATDRTGTIRGQNGLCLDLTGALPVDDNRVQVFECNGTNAQTWTLATDGTLRVMGKCALIVGDNSVRIVTCDGRTTAQWRAANSLLTNAANGNCLTDPSAGSRSGTPAVVAPCGGSASQRWSLP